MRSSLARTTSKGDEQDEQQERKRVDFSVAQFRFFDYEVGQGVPSRGDGPSLGFAWDWQKHDDDDDDDDDDNDDDDDDKPSDKGPLEISVDALEELRGGFSDAGGAERLEALAAAAAKKATAGEPGLEDDARWRVPRQQFQEYGGLSAQRRVALLFGNGRHRRPSIDLDGAKNKALVARRRSQAKSRLGQLVVDGFDVDALQDLQVREEAAARLSAWGHECAIAARRRRQRQQQQQQQQHDEGKGAEAEAEGEEKGSGSGTWWLAAAVDLSIL
jgi:hypothetical protein